MWSAWYFTPRHFDARYFLATGGTTAAEVISNLSYSTNEQIRYKMGTAI